jgi:hypothetical protein
MFNIITGPVYLVENLHYLNWFEYIGFFILLLFSFLLCASESGLIFLPTLFLLIYGFYFCFEKFGLIYFDWVYTIILLLEYFIVGFLYSTIKWTIFCAKKSSIIKSEMDNLLKRYNSGGWKSTFKEELIREDYIPLIRNYKYKIFYWTFWWPFDIVVYITQDLFLNIFDIIYKISGSFFTFIQEKVFDLNGIDKKILNYDKTVKFNKED